MSAKTNNFRIGIFVLAAIVLLVAGLLAFGARSYFQKKTLFETVIDSEVYGLSVGSPVQLRGVPVGKVTDIDFAWNVYPQSKLGYIIVRFEIDGNILPVEPGVTEKELVEGSTRGGLRAVVKSQGITGTSMLALEKLNPTNYPPLAIDFIPKHIYIPSAPAQLTRMLESIEKSLNNLQQIDLASIGQGVSNTLASVTRLVDNVNQADMKTLSTNANGLMVQVKDLGAKLQDTIEGMKLESVSHNADELLAGLRDTNTKLQLVLDRVNTVPLQQTVSDLHDAVRNLNEVLVKMNQYPSGFFLGEPPAPAKSVQTPSKPK
jgi:phospholipid/cholesterol/gamma-HCH transport system substrate-binding protein